MQIFSADKIFTGTQWLDNTSIIIENGLVASIVATSEVALNENRRTFENCFIVPAFIDIQVYGAAQKLLAVCPEAATLQVMYDAFSKQGTCLFLPTMATNTIDAFKKSIDAVRKYWEGNGKGVYGLHLEGPWLHETKRGAHVKEWIHPPTVAEVKELLDHGKGIIKMITIAPEVCSNEIIDLILAHGIIISAGHSNATYNEAIKSFNEGVSAVTHLYNAMSPLHHREPGLVGAAFHHPAVMASIIPDGYHVDYAAISIAKNLMGNRLFAITDAVTETAIGPYQHHLAGDKYECNGVLSGSALSMHKAFKNLINEVGIDIDEALRMCSLYPARVLGCDNVYGKIIPQAAGQFLVLDRQLEIVDWINL